MTAAAHAASGGADPLVLILIGFALAVAYCVSVLIFPWHPCPRCKGTRVKPGSNAKRWGPCKHCGGAGRTQRFGAGAVHRFWWSILGDTLRERHQKRMQDAGQRSAYPDAERKQ